MTDKGTMLYKYVFKHKKIIKKVIAISNDMYIFADIIFKPMEDYTLIQLKLPNDFNFKLDVYIAKLKRDRRIKDEKTKAQILISLAAEQLNKYYNE